MYVSDVVSNIHIIDAATSFNDVGIAINAVWVRMCLYINEYYPYKCHSIEE